MKNIVGTPEFLKNVQKRSSCSTERTRSTSQSSTGSSKNRKKSSVTLRAPRSRTNPPFQISLNLVMKVKQLDSQEFSMEPYELCLNDINMLPKKDGKESVPEVQKKKGFETPATTKNCSNAEQWFTPGNFSAIEKDEASEFASNTVEKSRETAKLNDSTQDFCKAIQPIQQKPNPSVVAAAADEKKYVETCNSQTSQRSSKSLRRSVPKNYPGKKSLLKFACLNNASSKTKKSGKKSTGSRRQSIEKNTLPSSPATAKGGNDSRLPGDEICPPRRLSFNDTPNLVPDIVDSHLLVSPTVKRLPKKKPLTSIQKRFVRSALRKPRSKSTGTALTNFQPFPPPQRLSFNDSNAPSGFGNSTNNSVTFSQSIPKHVSFNNSAAPPNTTVAVGGNIPANEKINESVVPNVSGLNSSTNSFGANDSVFLHEHVPHPRRLSFNASNAPTGSDGNAKNTVVTIGKNIPLNKAVNESLVSNGGHEMNSSTGSSGGNGSVLNNTLDNTLSFSDCSPGSAAADFDISVPLDNVKEALPLFNHQRTMRVGFIANGIPTVVNLNLNIRSHEEILYLEPIELLYEGQKMWRRSARQVTKEMEVQRAADQKRIDSFCVSTASSVSCVSTARSDLSETTKKPKRPVTEKKKKVTPTSKK